jgi:hypothetical protein
MPAFKNFEKIHENPMFSFLNVRFFPFREVTPNWSSSEVSRVEAFGDSGAHIHTRSRSLQCAAGNYQLWNAAQRQIVRAGSMRATSRFTLARHRIVPARSLPRLAAAWPPLR